MSSTMEKIKDTLHLNKDHQKTAISTTDKHNSTAHGNDAARVPRYTDTGAGTGADHTNSSGGYIDSLRDNFNLGKENHHVDDTGPHTTSYVAPGLNHPVSSTRHDNTTGFGHNNKANEGGLIDKAKNVLNLNKDHRTSGTGSYNSSESSGPNYTTGSRNDKVVDSSFIDKAKNALNLNKDNHDGSGSAQNYTAGSGYTSYSATGNEEGYKDKVKNALHLGQDNQQSSTTGSSSLSPGTANNSTGHYRPEPIETKISSNRQAQPDIRYGAGVTPNIGSSVLDSRNNPPHSRFGLGSDEAESRYTPGSGTAQGTAGPHNSDFLNRADPRVDSDIDGSRTIGGNKTHT